MDSKQRHIITRNLDKLLELTQCDDILLARLRVRNIFGAADIEAIRVAGKNDGPLAMSTKFYGIIQTKSGSFEELLEALRYTNQTGAVALLDDSSEGFPNHQPRFSGVPDYMTSFLNAKGQTVLVVNSGDCVLTCQRICETVTNCKMYTVEAFLKCMPSTGLLNYNFHHIPAINCEESVEFVMDTLCPSNGKFVVVTSSQHDDKRTASHTAIDKITWNNIHPSFRHEIQLKIQCDLGLTATECSQLFKGIEQDLLIQLIKNGVPSVPDLFTDTIPHMIKYYIPRRLMTRSVISSDIFTKHGPDLFLISGLQRHQLSALANGRPTITSTQAIQGTGVDNSIKFILLENDSHFDKIMKLASGRPVHSIKYEGEKIIWIKSSVSVDAIQNYVAGDQAIIPEEDFIQQFINNSDMTKDPVCISDTPGMGKTVLLTNIARKLQASLDNGFVGFMVISELVDQVKQRCRGLTNLEECTFRVVAENLCRNRLGLAYFHKNSNHLANLLLDGFDEVSAYDIELAYNLLNVLRSILPHTRLWISTRPHMLMKLEKSLNVMGYNIMAFGEEDQIRFLKSFWSTDMDGPRQEEIDRLEHFATECLKSIKSRITSDKERDIAGIPLQCLLIGEVYKEDANEYWHSTDAILPEFTVKSIADLYKKLVSKKFAKFYSLCNRQNISREDVKRAHIFHAVNVLFPSFLTQLADLHPQLLSTQEIFDVGIIESTKVLPAPRFLHRTLAEFFLALYLVESMVINWTTEKSDLLYHHVLDTKPINLNVNNQRLQTHEFKNNVICYFIDSYLTDVKSNNIINIVDKSADQKLLQKISEASVYGSFEELFSRIVHPVNTNEKYHSVYSIKFLAICTMHSGVKTSSLAYKTYWEINKRSIAKIKLNKSTLLHFAVIGGNYSLVEHLIYNGGFQKYVTKKPDDFCNLIHGCVQNSHGANSRIMRNRTEIIRLLANIHENLLIGKDTNGNLPIFSKGIDVHLAVELLKLSKDSYSIRDVLKYLHSSVQIYNCDECRIILKHIHRDRGSTYFSSLTKLVFEGRKLLDKIFHVIEPDDKLLNFLHLTGVSFHEDNKEGHSVLELSVQKRQNGPIITWLLDNVKFTDYQLNRSFIQAVLAANAYAVNALLAGRYVDVNCKASENENMLQLLLSRYQNSFNVVQPIALKLVQYGVSLYTENAYDVAVVEQLLSLVNPDDTTLDLVKSLSAYTFKQDDNFRLVQAAARHLRCHSSLQWLLNNIDLSKIQLETCLVEAVKFTNASALAAILDGEYVSLDMDSGIKENLLQVLFNTNIYSCREHYDVAKQLTNHGVSIHDEDDIIQNIFDKLIATKTTQNQQWWNLVELLLNQINTTPFDRTFKKAVLLIRRNACDKEASFDSTLLETLRDCISHLRSIDQADENGNTLLHFASYDAANVDNKYTAEIWKMIIDGGADAMSWNRQYISPICKLMKNNLKPELRSELFLYAASKVSRSALDKINGMVVLTVRENSLSVIKMVCQWYNLTINKPIPSITGNFKGNFVTMLDMALLSYDSDVLEYLLNKHQCQVAFQPFGTPWIHTCVQRQKARNRTLQYLTLVNSFKPELVNAENEDGLVPLSTKMASPEYITHLVKLGANVNKADALGRTPLHWALKNNIQLTSIQALLKCGADVNAATFNMETPLLLTLDMSCRVKMEIFKLLINHNANPGSRDKNGNTVIHRLLLKFNADDFCEIVQILIEKGQGHLFSILGANGRSPLEIARGHFHGNSKVLRVLTKLQENIGCL